MHTFRIWYFHIYLSNIDQLKKSLREFQESFHTFLTIRGKEKNKGNKHHWLVHLVEWCEFFRFSPSWVDDQRQESIHQLIRYFAHRYRKKNKEDKIELMAEAINNCTFNHC